MTADLDKLTEQVSELITRSNKTIVFSGAGISTESGIPDFRSPGGIWDRFDPNEFTYQKFLADATSRKKHWYLLKASGITTKAQPNAAHYAVAELYRLGKLDCVITQNVDNLHQKAGMPADRVLELHGNMQWVVCLTCDRRYPLDNIMPRLDREDVPDCEACHGILKPDGVFFGEALPERVLREATRRSSSCDLFIVIGSTLVVYPAAYMPEYAIGAAAKLVIINLSTTPLDYQATVLIRAKAGETTHQIAQKVKEKLNSSPWKN